MSEFDGPEVVGEPKQAKKVQWGVIGKGKYSSVGETVSILPSGLYESRLTPTGLILEELEIKADELLVLPDFKVESVVKSIRQFWNSKEKFIAMKYSYKRGILLMGPPGSGKTSTAMLAISEVIAAGGIALNVPDPSLLQRTLVEIRSIEKERAIVNIIEDIDEMLKPENEYDRRILLSILDGELQVDNIVHIATTNHPEVLDPRIVQRPSRFDELVLYSAPTPEVREFYFRKKLAGKLSEEQIHLWVQDTHEFGLASLRELIVAVFCLGRGYEESLEKLRTMQKAPPKSIKPEGKSEVGF